jgi:hypothetical protein
MLYLHASVYGSARSFPFSAHAQARALEGQLPTQRVPRVRNQWRKLRNTSALVENGGQRDEVRTRAALRASRRLLGSHAEPEDVMRVSG